jgi:hypothetical protein
VQVHLQLPEESRVGLRLRLAMVRRERSMSQALTEGTLYIRSIDHGWGVSFVPTTPGSHGSTGIHACERDEGLIAFLQELGIPQERIDGALKELRLRRNVSLYPIRLPSEQIQRYGL